VFDGKSNAPGRGVGAGDRQEKAKKNVCVATYMNPSQRRLCRNVYEAEPTAGGPGGPFGKYYEAEPTARRWRALDN
jgi:hypothetical protein